MPTHHFGCDEVDEGEEDGSNEIDVETHLVVEQCRVLLRITRQGLCISIDSRSCSNTQLTNLLI